MTFLHSITSWALINHINGWDWIWGAKTLDLFERKLYLRWWWFQLLCKLLDLILDHLPWQSCVTVSISFLRELLAVWLVRIRWYSRVVIAFHDTGVLFLGRFIDLEEILLRLWNLYTLALFKLIKFPTNFHVWRGWESFCRRFLKGRLRTYGPIWTYHLLSDLLTRSCCMQLRLWLYFRLVRLIGKIEQLIS